MSDGAETDETDSESDSESDSEAKAPTHEESLIPDDERSDDGQVYVERENLDFDPDDGLYSGTAIDGSTDIPGPHEQTDDVEEDSDSE